MRKFALIAAVLSGLVLAGCNTIAGVGRDVSAAGQAVTGAANDARN